MKLIIFCSEVIVNLLKEVVGFFEDMFKVDLEVIFVTKECELYKSVIENHVNMVILYHERVKLRSILIYDKIKQIDSCVRVVDMNATKEGLIDMLSFQNLTSIYIMQHKDAYDKRVINDRAHPLEDSNRELYFLGVNQVHYWIKPIEILYIERLNGITNIHLVNGEQIDTKRTIDYVFGFLPDIFLRCHKSTIVNRSYVRALRRNELFLFNGQEVSVSRSYIDEIRRVLCVNETKLIH
ncbi:MAG: LytTR family transcriptional regulator DNA-binding domain-containing protein [Clostridioides sp.]|jgi:hypothetical protein|nr:LytTR family transcriptional regulator DNA-binding domain-containing protein [Clostridioides sp.]